ncbi:MAG: PSD1 domain-containing protein [Planctomycetales bacterium]|nr:PSD1 domain-containing protein [Planctomycetales bacterium]
MKPHSHLPRKLAFLLILGAVAAFSASPTTAADPAVSEAAVKQFETHIRPLLATRCIKCHGAEKQEGQLRLDTREGLLKGGESGAAIVLGKPAESLLIEAIHYEGLEMPPNRQLDAESIQQMEQWIAAGAAWPESKPLRPEAAAITAEDRQWWAFRPLVPSAAPQLADDSWSANDVDRFVWKQLRDHQLLPAPEASREALIRRLYFNLIGLPPTPEEIDAFLADTAPDAWERTIDKLLDDPRYGEHWARFWLDLVRYSESDGWNQDAHRPHIWRYRDYVIQAFNQDKPYPEFVREQLAGDQLHEDNPEHLAAAGFLRLGIYEYNQRDARGHWNDIMNEMTDVSGDVFLGISMACARCHDHKFDPVPRDDYFKLRAFFEPVIWRDDLTATTEQQRRDHADAMASWEEASREVRQQIDELLKPYNDKKWKSTVAKFPLDIQACFHKAPDERNSWEQQMTYLIERQFEEEGGGPLKSLSKEHKARYDELQKELAQFDKLKPQPLPGVMTVTEYDGQAAPTRIPDDPGSEAIPPGFLSVLSPAAAALPDGAPGADSTSRGRRLQLAEWIGRSDNPLTMRVIVNRIWQQHFGEGIVRTPNDLGHNGEAPTHPELLDWLTGQFIEGGLRMKPLHKTILMSATWRQSSHHPDAERQQALDPGELLLWRAPVRRLRAEQIRDAMLSVSGHLDPKHGGPSVEESTPRRGVYVKSFRNKTETFMHLFDLTGGLKSVAVRNTTTTPIQSLLMINGAYATARAKGLADRVLKSHGADPIAAVQRLTRLTWGRAASEDELRDALAFLELPPDPGAKLDAARFRDLAHVLLNSSEFLYLD